MNPAQPVIDVHAHYLPRPLVEAAEREETRHGIAFSRNERGDLVYVANGQSFFLTWPNPEESPDERVAKMDAARVDVQLVSMAPNMHAYDLAGENATTFARETNDDLAELVAAQPGRFRGLAFLPLQHPEGAVDELERIMDGDGFVGAMVSTNVNGGLWDDPELFSVLSAAEELDALLFVHPARPRSGDLFPKYHLRNVIGLPVETTTMVASLIFGGVLDRLPDLKICLAHGGGYTCFAIGRFDHAASVRHDAVTAAPPSDYLRRFHYDTLTHSGPALRYVIDTVGPDRVVLGTDYPADMGLASPVAWIEGLTSLDSDERRLILGGNLAGLLGTRLPATEAGLPRA
jgi:aminocarboxymuconate-semialdehyde decarboxylase